jgi:hypothetical protein
MIGKTKQEYKDAKRRLLARIAGQFVPPSGYECAYNELREELKQCPVDARNQP